jgi:outer membrane lipoprotein
VFAAGRRVTILGAVVAPEERALGDLPYRYPVIAIERIRLWPTDPPPYLYPDPYWPYYPWGYFPWPYYPYRPYRYWR